MSIKFRTDAPGALLNKFKNLINQDEAKGRINTWAVDGSEFHHTAKDWKDRALFKATISDDNKYLIFSIIKLQDKYAYAYYHGHLLQIFIEHLNEHFQSSHYSDGRKK